MISLSDVVVVCVTDEEIDMYGQIKSFSLMSQFQEAREKVIHDNDELYERIQTEMTSFGRIWHRRASPPLLESNRLILCKYLRKDGDYLSRIPDELKNDKTLVKIAVMSSGQSIQYASEKLRADREIVYLAACKHEHALKYVDPDLLKDRDFVMTLVSAKGTSVLEFASEELRNDDEIVKKALEICPYGFQHLPDQFRNDRNIVLETIKRYPNCFSFTCPELQKDKEIILEAIKRNNYQPVISSDLKNDVEFMRMAIKLNSELFQYAPECLKNDKQFIMEQIRTNSSTFKHISPELKDDRDIVLLTLYMREFDAMEMVGKNSKKDKEIVKTALIDYSAFSIMRTVSEELLLDKEFCLELLEIDQTVIDYVRNTELLNDKDLIMKLIESNPRSLYFAGEDLKNDRECVLKALHYGADILEYATSDELINDKYIVIKAISQYGGNINSVNEKFQNDRDFVLKAIRCGGYVSCIPIAFQNDREILEEAFNYFGHPEIPESMLNDRKLYLTQVKTYGFRLESSEMKRDREWVLEYSKNLPNYIPELYSDDREIVYECVKRDGKLIELASKRLRSDKALSFLAISNYNPVLVKLDWRMDMDFLEEVLRKHPSSLSFFRNEFSRDREFALLSAKYGVVLDHFSGDREIVLLASKNDGYCIFGCDVSFRSDFEFMFNVVTNNSHLLVLASEELKDDKELVLHAMKSNEEPTLDCLPHISDRLRNDYGFILEISKHIANLFWIPENLRNNKEIVLNAMSKNGMNLRYVSLDFRNDKEIVLVAVKQTGDAIKFASKPLQNDRQVVSAAIPTCTSFYFLSKELRMDRDFILENIEKNGQLLDAVPHFQSDKEIVIKAVMNKGNILNRASDDLKIDRQVVMAAVTNLGEALTALDEDLRNDKEIVLAATTSHPESLLHASYQLRTDREFILQAVKKNPKLFAHLEHKLQNDEEIATAAIELDVHQIAHASYRLKHNVKFLQKLNQQDNILIKHQQDLWYLIDMQGLKNSLKQ